MLFFYAGSLSRAPITVSARRRHTHHRYNQHRSAAFTTWYALAVAITLTLGGCDSVPVREQAAEPMVAQGPLLAHDFVIEPGPPPADGAAPSDTAVLERIRERTRARQSLAQLEPDNATTPYEDLWQRLRAGMSWPTHVHKRIDLELQWYRTHPDYLQRVTDRARLYLAYIVAETEARGLPHELALLPIVESAFQPYARSPAGAAGIWQFIAPTAHRFRLRHSQWYDARRDVIDSTRAALDYLSHLYERLGDDWLLAVAGYNAGEGTVLRALRRNRERDLPTDFFALDLPRETEGYVPRLLAVARIVADPGRYGLSLDPIDQKPYFEVIHTHGQVDLTRAATAAGISLNELMLLNAGFMRQATDPQGPHRLLIPREAVDTLAIALESSPEGLSPRLPTVVVREGDTLATIAKRHDTSVAALRLVNDIDTERLRAGDSIAVMPGIDSQAMASLSREVREGMRRAQGNETRKIYRVRSGDSLWLIARRHDTTVAKLKRWNRIGRRNLLRPGQRLVVWSAAKPAQQRAHGAAAIAAHTHVHIVAPGDSLWTIARQYRVSTDSLLRLNGLGRRSVLMPGQHIKVRAPKATRTQAAQS